MRIAGVEAGFMSGGRWHGLPGWRIRIIEPEREGNHIGVILEAEEIEAECRGMPFAPVEVFGAEPLAYGALVSTCRALLDAGHPVRVQTFGSISLSRLPDGVHRRVVWRKPRNNFQSSALPTELVLDEMNDDDEMVFMIESRPSFEYAMQRIREHRLTRHTNVEMMCDGVVTREHLGNWVLETGLPIRLGEAIN